MTSTKSRSLPIFRIASCFKIPEQGMKDYELLCQGTAFCVRHKRPRHSTRRQPHSHHTFVTCAHVLAPYRFTADFTEEWLKFVRDEHVSVRLHLPARVGETGADSSANNQPTTDRSIHIPCARLRFHIHNDLCTFSLPSDMYNGDNDAAMRGLEPMEMKTEPPAKGQRLTFLGYPVGLPQLQAHGHELDCVDNNGRRYAYTDIRLPIGVSGGPVVDDHGACRGVFQGILDPNQDDLDTTGGVGEEMWREKLRGRVMQGGAEWDRHAWYLPAADVEEFLGGTDDADLAEP